MSRPREHVLVTGGSGGIGAATCVALADAGFTPVVGFHRNRVAAREIAQRCGGYALELDLESETSVDAAVRSLEEGGAAVVGLVNAASPRPALVPFTKVPAEQMAAQWRANVEGPRRLLAGLIKRCFLKNRRGTIVGVLTAAMGRDGTATIGNMSAYVIAKYGQAGVLAAVAGEYPWLKVRSVSPSYTETPMLEAFDERFLAPLREQKRFNTPAEIAASIMEQLTS